MSEALSSAVLGDAPNSNCHGRYLDATVLVLLYSCGIMLAKASKMIVDDGPMHKSTSSLAIFFRKNQVKN